MVRAPRTQEGVERRSLPSVKRALPARRPTIAIINNFAEIVWQTEPSPKDLSPSKYPVRREAVALQQVGLRLAKIRSHQVPEAEHVVRDAQAILETLRVALRTHNEQHVRTAFYGHVPRRHLSCNTHTLLQARRFDGTPAGTKMCKGSALRSAESHAPSGAGTKRPGLTYEERSRPLRR